MNIFSLMMEFPYRKYLGSIIVGVDILIIVYLSESTNDGEEKDIAPWLWPWRYQGWIGYHISQKHRNCFMVWMEMERCQAYPSPEYPPITLYSASLVQPGPTSLTSLWTTRKQEQVKCLQVVWKLDPPQPLHSVVLIIIFSNIFSPSQTQYLISNIWKNRRDDKNLELKPGINSIN